ncbi:GHKL domain-containing protein [Bifidobacterium sp.]|uniref:GHKL domain-containing protein n=1 Tax=Bifidobacterium sp. TaxID=41200 RepID=UPI003D7E16D7
MRTIDMLLGFFTTNGMVVELTVSTLLFTWWLERRDMFWWRFLTGIAVMLVESMLWNAYIPQYFLTITVQNVIAFALVILWILQCWTVNIRQALFYFVMAGATQHLVYRGARLLSVSLHQIWDSAAWIDTYAYSLAQIPLYILAYLVFGRPMARRDISMVGGRSVFAMLLGMVLCVSVFTNMFNAVATPVGAASADVYTVFSLFDFVTCVFMLELAIELVSRQRAHAEGEVLRQLLYQQKRQMENTKETIDLINVKTHDLKKQISQLGPSISQEQADELHRLVDVYDSSVRTGNETLDVLLANKSMQCEQRGIQFDRMIDGGILDFMNPADIYSLVGNALDNALEAVSALPRDAERYVSVRIRRNKGMAMIRVENPFSGTLDFADGLPMTTKEDARYHGFGTRSIRMIAQKYHGYMSISARDGIFRLTVILPLP